MKLLKLLGIPFLAAGLLIAGCDSGDTIDTSKLERSFSNAQPASKSAIDELKAAVAARDYAKAGAALQKLGASASLTTDQKQAIADVSAQVKAKVTEQAQSAAKEGQKAVDDMQKRLTK